MSDQLSAYRADQSVLTIGALDKQWLEVINSSAHLVALFLTVRHSVRK